MKKITTIIMLALTALMLSSCVINLEPVTHTMYFQNDSRTQHVYDWYVKDSDGTKYVISKDYCAVPCNSTSAISGLYTKDYQVWFCIYSGIRSDVYTHSAGFVRLDSDTTFSLSSVSYYGGKPRSAEGTIEDAESDFVLIDSNGNKYELVTEIVYK